MEANGPGGHRHAEDCATLYAAWRRYHGVAADPGGRFAPADRLAAARERDMFGRQLAALGCDPFALLAEEPPDASLDEDEAPEAG